MRGLPAGRRGRAAAVMAVGSIVVWSQPVRHPSAATDERDVDLSAYRQRVLSPALARSHQDGKHDAPMRDRR